MTNIGFRRNCSGKHGQSNVRWLLWQLHGWDKLAAVTPSGEDYYGLENHVKWLHLQVWGSLLEWIEIYSECGFAYFLEPRWSQPLKWVKKTDSKYVYMWAAPPINKENQISVQPRHWATVRWLPWPTSSGLKAYYVKQQVEICGKNPVPSDSVRVWRFIGQPRSGVMTNVLFSQQISRPTCVFKHNRWSSNRFSAPEKQSRDFWITVRA